MSGLLFTVWTWWTPLLVWWMWTRKSAGKKWFVRWNRPLPKTQSWILSCKMSGKLDGNPQNYLDRRLSKSNPSRLRNAMQLHKKEVRKWQPCVKEFDTWADVCPGPKRETFIYYCTMCPHSTGIFMCVHYTRQKRNFQLWMTRVTKMTGGIPLAQ